MQSIIIAAPQSGSGKTTITLGIMACLRRRGLKVAPFKVGPDFIDPGYHRLVCGRPSINLDGWICTEEFVKETFAHHTRDADIAVIEGVMGLFDGIDGVSEAGSTAQIAKMTGSAVIFLVDARSQARSAAALVKGFAEFDPAVKLAGVIFNNVASENHGRILREALAAGCPDISVLGCIPRDEALQIPSRHLGLLTVEENPPSAEFLEHLAGVMERQVDIGGVLSVGATPCGCPESGRPHRAAPTKELIRIAIAHDAAFCFVYEDNLRLLREEGAELVEFSPLMDERLPEGIDGIYLPGGYPELFAATLAANLPIKSAIRNVIESGMPVYAECGGFIYLTNGVETHCNASLPGGETEFVGIFPVTTRLLPKRKALGYREVELATDSIIGRQGTVARGHEFHYSEMAELPASVERIYKVRKNGIDLGVEGYRYKNCLASYIHLHFGSNPELAAAFVANCREFKNH
jgi:cobyrinic acid a,c-diamide synthase